MLDTGAQPNIIKKSSLNAQAFIKTNETIQLTGITENVANTLGTTTVYIFDSPVVFHIVPDDFPVITQGILGSSFFTQYNACIDYRNHEITWHNRSIPFKTRESVVLPARTKFGLIVRISNPEIKVGYISRLRVCDGVLGGEALVLIINHILE